MIRPITKNSNDYDQKYMKIKFDLDDDLNKTIEIHNVTIVVRAIFYENNKYYSPIFLDECLYKLYTRKQKQLQQISMKKNAICKRKKNLYSTCLFINYNCIIDSC